MTVCSGGFSGILCWSLIGGGLFSRFSESFLAWCSALNCRASIIPATTE